LQEFHSLVSGLKNVKEELDKTTNLFQEEKKFDLRYPDFIKNQQLELNMYINIGRWRFTSHSLYIEVLTHGGFYKVCEDMSWDRVWMRWTLHAAPVSREDDPVPHELDRYYENSFYRQGHQHEEDYFPFSLEMEIRTFYLKNLYAYEMFNRQSFC